MMREKGHPPRLFHLDIFPDPLPSEQGAIIICGGAWHDRGVCPTCHGLGATWLLRNKCWERGYLYIRPGADPFNIVLNPGPLIWHARLLTMHLEQFSLQKHVAWDHFVALLDSLLTGYHSDEYMVS
jgi:hypothetical protein